MRKSFFLLLLLSSVITFAQTSLYSDLNPDGRWYTDESRDAAYESSVSQLYKTWICLSSQISSITFKPNGVGKMVISTDTYIDEANMDVTVSVEMPFTYTKNKDKITLKTNPLKAIMSINPKETNISQRKKDILENNKNIGAENLRNTKPEVIPYILYRIDDYMVLEGEWMTLKFVSEEYQAQAKARNAAHVEDENKEE